MRRNRLFVSLAAAMVLPAVMAGFRFTFFRAQQAPVVAIDPVNSGYPIERSACLTIALGPNAAAECGNLRIVHPLPSVRTFNRLRTPTLLYNSEFAHPYPAVPVLVTQLSTTTTPDSVEVILRLKIGGTYVPKDTTRWAGSEWPSGQTTTRRVTVAYDGTNDTTGYYPYQVEVANLYPFGVRKVAPASTGKMFLINRKPSPFGAGWWLAGLDMLINLGTNPDVPEKVWIGGDGSARFFVQHPTLPNTWYTAIYERSDTLYYDPGTLTWTKTDAEGLRTKFNSTGNHTQTIDRFGRTTSFSYTSGNLSVITIPPANQTYQFVYLSGKLSTVTAPPIGGTPRVTNITVTSSELRSIQDPGAAAPVTFAYHPAAGDQYVMAKRTDRRSVVDSFTVDSARRVRTGRIKMASPTPDIVKTLIAGETRGLAKSGTPSSVDSAKAYSFFDGPRTDVADTTVLFQSRFGPVRRVFDALANETRVKHGPEFGGTAYGWVPLRVQYVQTGRVMLAEYDLRGNLTALVDSATAVPLQSDTTRYAWDGKFDQLTKVVPPEKDSVVFYVSSVNGRRDSLKDARDNLLDGSPDSTVVRFGYDAQNQVTMLTLPVVAGQTSAYGYTYDATLRNLATVTSPKGLVSEYQADGVGRVTLTITRIDTTVSSTKRVHRKLTYDILDRVTNDTTMTVNVTPSQKVIAVHTYDPEGLLLSTKDTTQSDANNIRAVLHQWTYDNARRMVIEKAPDGLADTTKYDPAGNAVTIVGRRYPAVGAVTMQYDALNRLSSRTLPAVSLSFSASQISPSYPITQLPYAYTDAGDTETFQYAPDGQVSKAINKNATVSRGYDVTGRLRADTLQIKTADRSGFGIHSYISTYTYDRDGRRKTVSAPSVFAGTAILFGYDPGSGELTSITDIAGNAFTLGYDARNELSKITYPARLTRYLRYDKDGQLSGDTVTNTPGAFPFYTVSSLRQLRVSRDAQGRTLLGSDPASFFKDQVTATYSGLGILVQSALREVGEDAIGNSSTYGSGDNWSPDPLGRPFTFATRDTLITSQGTTITESFRAHTYQLGTGRLLARIPNPTPLRDTLMYDNAGNVVFERGWTGVTVDRERATYFGPLQQLLAADRRRVGRQTFEEYRYDALGRRVWVRQLTRCQGTASGFDCGSPYTRRIIWDGQQELGEIQAPYDTTNAAIEETDSGWSLRGYSSSYGDPNPFYGRVVYGPGLEVDAPLSVTRYEYRDNPNGANTLTWPTFTLLPFWNYQGVAAFGAFSDGAWQKPYQIAQNQTACPGPAGGVTGTDRCVLLQWEFAHSAYDRNRGLVVYPSWQGSLLEGKRDRSGLEYKRNRHYDAQAGQFTQEDPIGLAGGLNLYGFAQGDPVNFSDPLGLCPPPFLPVCAIALGVAVFGGTRIAYNAVTRRPLTESLQRDLARGSLAGLGTGALVGVAGMVVAADATAMAATLTPAAARLTVQFGRVANQISHTFRHVDELGLDREAVRAAVQQSLQTVASQLTAGKALNKIIEVSGVRLQYTAYQLPNGVVNVGRIHSVP